MLKGHLEKNKPDAGREELFTTVLEKSIEHSQKVFINYVEKETKADQGYAG